MLSFLDSIFSIISIANLGFVGLKDIIVLKFRNFHKIEYRYYPLIFCLGFLGFVVGLVLFISMGMFYPLIICFFYIFYVSFLWLKDIFLEDLSGQYSFYDYRIYVQGFRLFLFSELSLFFTIFWTFLDTSLCSLMWLGDSWCPIGMLSPDYFGVNGMARLFLMINSQFLKYSRRYLCMGLINCEFLLLFCIFIGSFFLCFQYFEYSNNSFVINDRIYGSIFYIGTGLHGLHVLIGVFFLLFNLFRIKMYNFNWYHIQSYDISIDYWRFLEWIWGFIFCLFYIWGS